MSISQTRAKSAVMIIPGMVSAVYEKTTACGKALWLLIKIWLDKHFLKPPGILGLKSSLWSKADVQGRAGVGLKRT
jgi:hypothetical protein